MTPEFEVIYDRRVRQNGEKKGGEEGIAAQFIKEAFAAIFVCTIAILPEYFYFMNLKNKRGKINYRHRLTLINADEKL